VTIPLSVRAIPSLTFRAWLTPPPIAPTTLERDRDAMVDFIPVYYGGIPGHEIGSGRVALALHGWGGRSAQMAPSARRLAAEGHRVIIPRLPGHAGGAPTDIKKVAAAVDAVVEDVGTPSLLVAHSFASMVLRLAFYDEAPRRVALIAPALDVRDALDVFADRLGLLPWARSGLRSRLQNWDPDLWPTLSQSPAHQLGDAEVLIMHDPDDRDTPFARSAELAAIRPATTIAAIEGGGHSRILSEPAVLDRLVAFATGSEVSEESAA